MFRKRVLEIKIKERSPDIDPLVRPFLLFRVQNAAELAASSAGTKVCSAGCGRAKQRADFSKKQWAGRAVRRCLDCVENRVEPKICAHGKGAFDCAACCEIVKHEAEAEAAAANKISTEQYHADKKYDEAVTVAAKTCAEYVKGQMCYICTRALHWETKEGLVRMCACRGTAGFAHVSCLAEEAKVLVAEVEENNLSGKVGNERWARWYACSLCEQRYHGVVGFALGWACWKTHVGRPETDQVRGLAMRLLGSGLSETDHLEDAFSVQEAELSILRRIGASEHHILGVQTNLASTYYKLGHLEKALSMERDVYSGYLKLHGKEHEDSLRAALNYTSSLVALKRFEKARALLRKTIPVARQVLGDNYEDTLKLRWSYAVALYVDPAATLDGLRESVETLAEIEVIARRVLGGAHPVTAQIGLSLRESRAALSARDGVSAVRGALEAMNAT